MDTAVRRVLIERCLCLAVLCAPVWAVAQGPTVSGVVRNDAPLPDVSVQGELDGRTLRGSVTDSEGRFTLPLDAGLTGRSDVTLRFSKQGFRSENRQLTGAAAALPMTVSLVPQAGSTAISDADRRVLDPQRASAGQGSLKFVPFRFVGGAEKGDVKAMNELLLNQLQRLILTHVQKSMDDVDTRAISFGQLDVSPGSDLQRMNALGEYVGALAVVSGLGNGGAVGANGGAAPGKTVELASEFVIIPRMPGFEPPVFDVSDVVPAGSIGSGSLPQNISGTFGHATVIALAVRDLRSAEGLPAAERATALRRVRSYLVKELRDVGNTSRDGIAASRLKLLKDLADKALAP